jgi:hypothetical protein
MSFGIGGGKESTKPGSVWNQQSPFLQGLYQRAYQASLGGGTGGQMVSGPQQQQQLPYNRFQKGGGVGPLQRAVPQGGVNTQPAPGQPGQTGGYGGDPLQGLGYSLTGQGQGMLGNLGMMGQIGNPFTQAQIGQLGQQMGTLFNQQVLPGIQSQFAGAGQLGGDRQALALGQAAGQFGQAFTGGALDILGNSSQLALQANNAGLGGLGSVFGAGDRKSVV